MRSCLAAKAKREQLRYLGNGALWSSVTEIAGGPWRRGCNRAHSRNGWRSPGSNPRERVVAIRSIGRNGLARRSLSCRQRNPAGGPPCLLLCRLAPFSLSAQQWFFRRGGDPSGTQLCDPADELHRNGFGEWEMDRPLSQFIALEIIFERREERPRCGKQRIVFLEAGEIQHRLSVQLVSGHAIPDALHCLRNGPPNRGAHLFELRPQHLGRVVVPVFCRPCPAAARQAGLTTLDAERPFRTADR